MYKYFVISIIFWSLMVVFSGCGPTEHDLDKTKTEITYTKAKKGSSTDTDTDTDSDSDSDSDEYNTDTDNTTDNTNEANEELDQNGFAGSTGQIDEDGGEEDNGDDDISEEAQNREPVAVQNISYSEIMNSLTDETDETDGEEEAKVEVEVEVEDGRIEVEKEEFESDDEYVVSVSPDKNIESNETDKIKFKFYLNASTLKDVDVFYSCWQVVSSAPEKSRYVKISEEQKISITSGKLVVDGICNKVNNESIWTPFKEKIKFVVAKIESVKFAGDDKAISNLIKNEDLNFAYVVINNDQDDADNLAQQKFEFRPLVGIQQIEFIADNSKSSNSDARSDEIEIAFAIDFVPSFLNEESVDIAYRINNPNACLTDTGKNISKNDAFRLAEENKGGGRIDQKILQVPLNLLEENSDDSEKIIRNNINVASSSYFINFVKDDIQNYVLADSDGQRKLELSKCRKYNMEMYFEILPDAANKYYVLDNNFQQKPIKIGEDNNDLRYPLQFSRKAIVVFLDNKYLEL